MKFLCLDCDEPMKLHETKGPDEGSLSVTFRCPECGFRVAMLTNPFETQMVRSLGVKVGGRAVPAEPFETLRTSMTAPRPDVFKGEPVAGSAGEGCPFAAALGADAAAAPAAPLSVAWEAAAEARLERIPSFIRPMARRSIERFAEDRGYPAITEAVMDEARSVFGM
jgi:DNA-directed RNA polymerase subunit RPC12/RpoP